MSDIIIGECNDDDYVLFGKLSDGTSIYKHKPVPPPDPSILIREQQRKAAIVSNYNESVELNQYDTGIFLQDLKKDAEDKERVRIINEKAIKTYAAKPDSGSIN
jgi:hypothetical protein